MDLSHCSREQLIDLVNELNSLNHQLLEEKAQEINLKFGWTGNLGHWYWNVKTNRVTFNPLKITTLGYSSEEIPEHTTYQFFTERLHPDDYQPVMDAMLNHLNGTHPVYEVEYRIQTKDGHYKWFYDRGRITQYDKQGKPELLAGIVFDITEKKELLLKLEEQNKQLEKLSTLDGLTKINNHRALIDNLLSEMNHSSISHEPLSIALLDVDNFKQINDRFGHLIGDQILIKIGELLKNHVKPTDIVGRYGGEEFMIIFKNTHLKEAVDQSENVRQFIEQLEVNTIHITISGGIATYKGESVSDFIQIADMNLYKAKNEGKNKMVFI